MEEQRISVMYWNLLKQRLAGAWGSLFPRGLRRSSALPALIVLALLIIPGLGYYLHMRGKFASFKREIKGEQQGPSQSMLPRPGGLDPLVLTRSQTLGSNMPEFRSMTLLPGLGMSVLQITANLPERGEVALLAAPGLEEVANSAGPRAGVYESHGAIELPWSGLLTGLLTPVGTTMRVNWRGRTFEVPTDVQGRASASGGVLATIPADSVETSVQSLGPVAKATFRSTDFNEHWPSRSSVEVTATLGARAIDLLVTVKNVGDLPEPVGIGWHPKLLIPGGARETAELRLPAGDTFESGDKGKGTPSGRIIPPGGPLSKFQGHPSALGSEALDASVVNPRPALLDNGPAAEIRDPQSGVGIRMTGLSASIHVFRAASPAGANYVSLGTQSNFNDPLGREWSAPERLPIATLMPGQSMDWKVRLELFAVTRK